LNYIYNISLYINQFFIKYIDLCYDYVMIML